MILLLREDTSELQSWVFELSVLCVCGVCKLPSVGVLQVLQFSPAVQSYVVRVTDISKLPIVYHCVCACMNSVGTGVPFRV